MADGLDTPTLTQQEFTPADHRAAERMAQALGYEQYAYTSTSQLWGLYCIQENPDTAKPGQAIQGGCIIKTKELGLLFVQCTENLCLHPNGRPMNAYKQTPYRRNR